MNEEVKIEQTDDLEQAIERNAICGLDMGLGDDEDFIPVTVLKNILDHFIPKWRKHEDRYYKLKKFATEQQLDRNICKLRNYVEEKTGEVMREIIRAREFMDEFRVQATAVQKIIDEDRIAVERIRMRRERKGD